MEKYYAVYFDEIGTELTLFENKYLSAREYTKSVDSEYIFSDVVYEEKVLNPSVKFLYESFLYDGYVLKDEACYYCNDSVKDGFMYDRKNQRVVYGKTPVYVKIVGDSFVDVVTNQIIPKRIVKIATEIESPELLHVMANDLKFISNYVDIYSLVLEDCISMFSGEVINMNVVQEVYDDLCFKKYREEYGYLNLDCSSFEEVEESMNNRTVLQVGEHQKIKRIVENIRKSSIG